MKHIANIIISTYSQSFSYKKDEVYWVSLFGFSNIGQQ